MKSSDKIAKKTKNSKKAYLILGGLFVLTLCVVGWVLWNKSYENIDKDDCLSYFEIDDNNDVDLAEGYLTSYIDGGIYSEYEGVDLNFNDLVQVIDGEDYLNYKYFSSFEYSESGNLSMIVNTDLVTKNEFGKFVEDLMKVNVIATYDHIGSDVCLLSDNDGTLKYKIKHYYCTNDCYDETYTMKITLEDDGGVTIDR